MPHVINKEPTQRFQDGDLVVEVYRADPIGYRSGPGYYSVRIGKELEKTMEDGSRQKIVVPHIRIYQDRKSLAQARLERPVAEPLTRLLEQAESWILAEMAERHEEYLAGRRLQEQEAVERGKLKTRRTGKTERDREKRRHREH